MSENLIERLAVALWNRIPYDQNAGCPTCPTQADALNALRGALAATGLTVESANYGYPPGWPKCPSCGAPALDGHITCGDVRCGESSYR